MVEKIRKQKSDLLQQHQQQPPVVPSVGVAPPMMSQSASSGNIGSAARDPRRAASARHHPGHGQMSQHNPPLPVSHVPKSSVVRLFLKNYFGHWLKCLFVNFRCLRRHHHLRLWTPAILNNHPHAHLWNSNKLLSNTPIKSLTVSSSPKTLPTAIWSFPLFLDLKHPVDPEAVFLIRIAILLLLFYCG